MHEVIFLDGCPIYDGATYGNRDGLLTDESVPLNRASLCRARQVCGRSSWTNPILRVEATDCGGNIGAAQIVVPGGLAIRPGECSP